MPPPPPTRPRQPPPPPPHIPLPYRLFLLYVEPCLLLPGGIYLALFQPRDFILATVPAPVSNAYRLSSSSSSASSFYPSLSEPGPPAPVTPLIHNLLANTAALYVLFMVNELLVLRLSSDVKVWRAVIFAMLCCDVGHLYGAWVAGGADFMLDPLGRWRMEDWVNVCLLGFGAGLRLCFLAGWGVKDRAREGEVSGKRR